MMKGGPDPRGTPGSCAASIAKGSNLQNRVRYSVTGAPARSRVRDTCSDILSLRFRIATWRARGLTNIGEEAKPPFAVLPDPSSLFLKRSERLRTLAPGHILESYLNFAADVTEAQHASQATLPAAVLPPAREIRQALDRGMPPLSRTALEPGEAGELTLRQMLESLRQTAMPKEAGAAIDSLAASSSERLRQLMSGALKDAPVDDPLNASLYLQAFRFISRGWQPNCWRSACSRPVMVMSCVRQRSHDERGRWLARRS